MPILCSLLLLYSTCIILIPQAQAVQQVSPYKYSLLFLLGHCEAVRAASMQGHGETQC